MGFGEDEDVGSLQWAKPLANPQGPKEIGMDWSRGRWDKPPTAAAGVVTVAICIQSFLLFFVIKRWLTGLGRQIREPSLQVDILFYSVPSNYSLIWFSVREAEEDLHRSSFSKLRNEAQCRVSFVILT